MALDQASSIREYNQVISFENRNLQIRELKEECSSLFQGVLSEHPGLAENAPPVGSFVVGEINIPCSRGEGVTRIKTGEWGLD